MNPICAIIKYNIGDKTYLKDVLHLTKPSLDTHFFFD